MTAAFDLTTLVDLDAAFELPPLDGLSDLDLMALQRTAAEIRRRTDSLSAQIAGRIAQRSRRELGYDGLAQRLGARTAERLVQTLTGVSAREAITLVRVGTTMTAPVADAPPPPPWLVDVTAAVCAGTVSVAAADAIRLGLGTPTDGVSVDALRDAARILLKESPSLTLEKLTILARDLRAELDLDGVADREQQLRDKRYLHLYLQPDGMTKMVGLLDPESAAGIRAVFDDATAPKHGGGPRFVDPTTTARAQEILNDPRTAEQLALDVFIDLIRIATLVDDRSVLGNRRPTIQIHVTDTDLRTRQGLGRIDGQLDPASIATIERHRCDTGANQITFNHHNQPLDVGRTQRTFTPRQRRALAARDGGCRFPDCDRPPSWTEAHHITWWAHGGRTDTNNGTLLCRHHHLLIHNNGWQIIREESKLWLTPPTTIDPHQHRIPMPTKNRTRQRALMAS